MIRNSTKATLGGRHFRPTTIALLLLFVTVPAIPDPAEQNWTHTVRIGAYGLHGGDAGPHRSQRPGRWRIRNRSRQRYPGPLRELLNPDEKLKAIREVAEKAHAAGNRAFRLCSGDRVHHGKCGQNSAHAGQRSSRLVTAEVTGEPAVFGGGTAFWIAKGDEDVWVSPYAPLWRKSYMERVRQIAATGIDGIYVDIPYWMTHFDGWEDTWASFDDYTLEAFRKETGLDAKKDLKLGDFADNNFRKWVEFRIHAITAFIEEIDQNAKSVNPSIKTIPEIYPGIEEEAARVGADVYSLYPVVDAVAHEYEFGSGDHMASSRTPLDWFNYQVGMRSFRAFAQGKATWILNYSWDGDQRVDRREAMMNLAVSQIVTGSNFWDAPGHSMAGSNDTATRRKIFSWIKDHENTFYRPRSAIAPIGVYFSPETRNYYAHEFIRSYRGISILLMQKALEFQVVTPRTLSEFRDTP